jgi:hypothetical protein
MSLSTSPCALYLCPKQHDFTIRDLPQFIIQLQHIGLIAAPVAGQDSGFFTGERFLDYIAYMGCSPAIQFEAPAADENFCQVIIHRYDAAKLIVSQTQTRDPHCPNCSKPVKDWLAYKTEETISCRSCNTTANIAEFDWRKMAGYARIFIEITDVFPKEAIPQQILLDKLTGLCKTDWLYFYSCQ